MAAPVTSTFDPIAYKATTQEQWQAAAEAWHRWGPTIEQWLGEATETMLDLAGVGEGARVPDVAAGAGGQTLTAARRVGPAGRVLASDIAPGDPGLRRGRGPPSRAGQRGHPGHGRRAARRRSRDLRRRHLEGGAHLLPRPAARAQRDAPVAASRRPGSATWSPGLCPRRCSWPRRPTVSGSSGSRSARCTRCSPAWTSPVGRRPGRR
jgi:hypothetical protein